tara:strand:+ start:1036 stop:1941 length:906 start_codon:yes stop_codon:yes gene_type:complete
MNKPVIQGTKAHSALLATAKAEKTRTHSGDPTLGAAATAYGESFSNTDVIDYNIKSRELDWSKKKNEDSTADNKSDTFQLDYKRRKLDRKIGPNKRKKIVAEEDKNKAINTLIANAGADDTEGQDENKQFDSEGNEITIVNPESVIGYPHDYSDLDKIVTPKVEEKTKEKIEEIIPEIPKLDQFAGRVESVDGVRISKLERAVINDDFYYDFRENPEKYRQILIDGEKTWVIRPWFTKQKKKIERKNKTDKIKENIQSIFTPKKQENITVEEKKEDKKPRRWQFKTINSYNAAIKAWKEKQ